MPSRMGFWARLPWGTYRFPSWEGVVKAALLVLAVLLVGDGIRSYLDPKSPCVDVVQHLEGEPHVGQGRGVHQEPLSELFGLRSLRISSISLESTFLGSTPRATVQVAGSVLHVGLGDSLEGAVVESIGRGIIVLRHRDEVLRVGL